MKRILLAFVLCLGTAAFAQAPVETMFIPATPDGFEVYLAAAMAKKKVPVLVTTKEEGATYILKASEIEVHKESTGSKFARCLFAYCSGIEDKGSVSVQLVQRDVVLWSYAVNKGRGGQKNKQSMAEAVAKHLRHEHFRLQ
jgi:hypothetical protein